MVTRTPVHRTRGQDAAAWRQVRAKKLTQEIAKRRVAHECAVRREVLVRRPQGAGSEPSCIGFADSFEYVRLCAGACVGEI